MASAAIGTSHLIQTTRAGANFGYEMLVLIIAVNVLKYPFIECGFRYNAATGRNILEGYKKLHKSFFVIFILVNIFMSIMGVAAVSYICAAIFASILHITSFSQYQLTIIIMSTCAALIIIGHYKFLDSLMKIFMITLVLATSIAVVIVFIKPIVISNVIYTQPAFDIKYIPFMLALMGWMPGPIELSVWHSLWLEAFNRNNKKDLNFQEARCDFNIGYFLTMFAAILFLILGSEVLHKSGQLMSDNGMEFTDQLVSVYALTIGSWSEIIISLAVAMAILSTVITLIDIYPRTLASSLIVLKPKLVEKRRTLHALVIIASVISGLIVLSYIGSFKLLLDIVTTTAFLSSPIFAYMNHRLVYGGFIDKKYQPNKFMYILSWLGLIFLTAFCGLFIYSLLALNS